MKPSTPKRILFTVVLLLGITFVITTLIGVLAYYPRIAFGTMAVALFSMLVYFTWMVAEAYISDD